MPDTVSGTFRIRTDSKERMLQKENMTFDKRREKHEMALDKLLEEFPWLWGISRTWNPRNDTIKIVRANDKTLSGLKFADLEFSDTVWIKHRASNFTTIMPLPERMAPRLIASAACQKIKPYYSHLEAIVVYHKECLDRELRNIRQTVTIYLGKKTGDLENLCKEIAKKNPEPERVPRDPLIDLCLQDDGL